MSDRNTVGVLSEFEALARLRRRRFGVGYRVRAAMAMVMLLPSVTGCYRYVPVTVTPTAPGTEVSVAITDHGRVALAGQLGPGARRLRGRLVETTDSVVVVGLSMVEYIGSPRPAQWTGEVISIPRTYVSDVRERRFSRSRSWLTAGVLVALAAAVSTIAIAGLGSDAGENRPPPGGGEQ